MAVIVNGDGILSGVSSLTTDLTDITSGRGTVTGVATVGTLQLGTGVSMSSPRSQNAAIFTNNTEFFTVDDAGRVGVGTTTPNSDAHPENEKKINVGFITARSIAGDIDGNTLVVAGLSTFIGAATFTDNITLNSTDKKIYLSNDSDQYITANASSNYMVFATANSERIRIDSSGRLLLGTTTEGSTEADDLTIATSGHTGITLRSGTTHEGNIFFSDGTSGADEYRGLIRYDHDGDKMIFGTGDGSERLRIDSSGRMGLGITPTDYHSNNTAVFQLKDGNSIFSRTGGTFFGMFQNIKYNSSDVSQYVTSNPGSAYFQTSGTHKFYTAASGTADNNATLNERLRITTDGNLSIVDGNLVLANGHGIDFSATANSGTSELLDDYEEGSWTPTFVGAAGAISVAGYSLQDGRYTKIGNYVYIEGQLRGQVTNNSTGTYDIGGLPYTVDTNGSGGVFVCYDQASWIRAPHQFIPILNATTARAREGIDVGDTGYTNGASDAFNAANTNCNRVYFAGSYRVA